LSRQEEWHRGAFFKIKKTHKAGHETEQHVSSIVELSHNNFTNALSQLFSSQSAHCASLYPEWITKRELSLIMFYISKTIGDVIKKISNETIQSET
jgi:hypothetical protein